MVVPVKLEPWRANYNYQPTALRHLGQNGNG